MRVGLAGCGDISVVHLEALQDLEKQGVVELAGVCDPVPERAEAAGREHGVPWFTGHRGLLDEGRPDVLHVCTPHDQHLPVALDALAEGVHVLTEKPLAATLADAERFAAAADDAATRGVKVGVCYQNRYNTPVAAMRDLLASGRCGRVLGGHATVVWHRTPGYYDARPWRAHRASSGGGALINQAIHTVDLLTWLLGDPVRVTGSVAAHGLWEGEPGAGRDVEDTAHVVLDHAGGARSVLLATVAGVADSPVVLEVVTERTVLFLRGDLTVTWDDGSVDQVQEQALPSSGRSYWGVSHARLIEDFCRRLPDPEPFWIGPREALVSLGVLHSLYQNPLGD